MIRCPKVADIQSLIETLERNPFGSLVLVVLVLSTAFEIWLLRQ